MTGTVLYVHGAGNRKDKALENAAKIARGFGEPSIPDWLHVSTWGEQCAPDPELPLLDRVLPKPPVEPRLLDEAADDAYAPLRALAADGEGIRHAVAVAGPDVAVIIDSLRAWRDDDDEEGATPSIRDCLQGARVRAAADEVAASSELANAVGSDAKLVDAIVRVVAARSLELGAGVEPAGRFIGERWQPTRIAAALANRLLSAAGGVLGSAATAVGDSVLLALSGLAAPYRECAMRTAMFLTTADVLFYQRRGAEVREHLMGELAACPRPILALGHSLGGIALVDTLFGPDAVPRAGHGVELLITFGSQSAMLGAIGALDAVNPTIPWTNIWTRNDFASFLASGLWPDAQDREVVIDAGFPDAHGKYYDQWAFFEAIREAAAEVEAVAGLLPPRPAA